MRAQKQPTLENFRSALETASSSDPTDPDRLWSTRTLAEIPKKTFRLTRPFHFGYFALRENALLGVTVYDVEDNPQSVAKFDLFVPRRLAHDRDERYFFDTDRDSTDEDVAAQGGLQDLNGSFNLKRSRDLRKLIEEAHLQARSASQDLTL